MRAAALILLAFLVPAANAAADDGAIVVHPLPQVPGNTIPESRTGALQAVVEEIGHVEITCVYQSDNPTSAQCYVCFGPGKTQTWPVEPQGAGFAIGVPGQSGTYTEWDRYGRASCD